MTESEDSAAEPGSCPPVRESQIDTLPLSSSANVSGSPLGTRTHHPSSSHENTTLNAVSEVAAQEADVQSIAVHCDRDGGLESLNERKEILPTPIQESSLNVETTGASAPSNGLLENVLTGQDGAIVHNEKSEN